MRRFITLFLILLTHQLYAQNTNITGRILEEGTEEAIIGASIVIKGTTTGTSTDIEGNFTLQTQQTGTLTLQISSVGMKNIEKVINLNVAKLDLGTMYLVPEVVGLGEVEVFASIAIDRKTPVAASTVSAKLIQEKIGTQEFPQILKSTPGIYTTRQGGGFGDARVNIRGFSSENVAVMINGIPVNDMENGVVYWSNWAGLTDVTSSMQVQRGLGAAKVAVPSVGGTINVITQNVDAKKGASVKYDIGNNGYEKKSMMLSTGKNEKGWAMTFLGSRTTGDGYVEGTYIDAWSYFFNISKQINSNHLITLNGFGAPQEHGKRNSRLSYDEMQEHPSGRQYNKDWGYKDGQIFTDSKNFYHKPQFSLNHYWTISDKMNLNTSVYTSIGRGGGSYSVKDSNYEMPRDYLGRIQWDQVVEDNAANGGSLVAIQGSMNEHNWIGGITSLSAELIEGLDLLAGLDYRMYEGKHYYEMLDLLGGNYYEANRGVNSSLDVVKVGDVYGKNYDGNVQWAGAFAQAEYNKDELTAFVSTSVSLQSQRRVGRLNYVDGSDDQTSDWVSHLGYTIKGGANYNIDEYHNVFANLGYIERQPNFNAVFYQSRTSNVYNEEAVNEKILSAEIGYGFRSDYFSANLNVYYTKWLDKNFQDSYTDSQGRQFVVNFLGVDAIHKGIEIDMKAKPLPNLELTGMASIGDWRWANNLVNQEVIDETTNEVVAVVDLFIEDLKVGDAAQTTFALGASYELMKDLKIGIDYNYFDHLFGDFDPLSVSEENYEVYKLPAYGLFDMNANYSFSLNGVKATVFGNVLNIFDTEYIADANNNFDQTTGNPTAIYPGFGRTWSVGLKVSF